jgi:hypothetical protein
MPLTIQETRPWVALICLKKPQYTFSLARQVVEDVKVLMEILYINI